MFEIFHECTIERIKFKNKQNSLGFWRKSFTHLRSRWKWSIQKTIKQASNLLFPVAMFRMQICCSPLICRLSSNNYCWLIFYYGNVQVIIIYTRSSSDLLEEHFIFIYEQVQFAVKMNFTAALCISLFH